MRRNGQAQDGLYGRFIERVADVGAARDWPAHQEALEAAAKDSAAKSEAAAKAAKSKKGGEMMPRGRNPYECFKNDRHRLFALLSRDVRIVLVAAILGGAGLAGSHPVLRSLMVGWLN